MDWPGQSPDLNPIDNLWVFLNRSIQRRYVNNKYELLAAALQAWQDLPKAHLETLADSMPGRVRDVIKEKGGSTRY